MPDSWRIFPTKNGYVLEPEVPKGEISLWKDAYVAVTVDELMRLVKQVMTEGA